MMSTIKVIEDLGIATTSTESPAINILGSPRYPTLVSNIFNYIVVKISSSLPHFLSSILSQIMPMKASYDLSSFHNHYGISFIYHYHVSAIIMKTLTFFSIMKILTATFILICNTDQFISILYIIIFTNLKNIFEVIVVKNNNFWAK